MECIHHRGTENTEKGNDKADELTSCDLSVPLWFNSYRAGAAALWRGSRPPFSTIQFRYFSKFV